MSKTTVGEVYARVIKDVVDLSRTDFEEQGVEASALELLQSEWQTRLSALGTTTLPWDPAPTKEEKPTIKRTASPPPPPGPSNGNNSRSQIPPQAPLNTLPPIKQEHPQYPPQPNAPQQYPAMSVPQGRPMEAQHRAAQLLQGRFGDQASQQVARLNGIMPNQQGHPQGTPYIKEEVDHQYSHPIKTDQTDGGNDDLDTWKTEYARRKALIAEGRANSDNLIRDHVAASQQQLEGGGLLLPLSEHREAKPRARRAVAGDNRPSASVTRAQGDAGDDDEVDDADAINSDLDDPDDLNGINEEDEEEGGKVMLCTYDKVQRVKNKWKCTLKDGILRIDGNEYLFHKGNGEFEW